MAKRPALDPAPPGTLRIDYVPLRALKANPRNPKDHDLGEISKSFERFGFVEPIIVDERTGLIGSGHGRMKTLREAYKAGVPPPDRVQLGPDGDWLVPVVRGWASKNDTDAAGFLVAANRLTQLGGWNQAALADTLTELAHANALAGTGFDGDDVDALVSRLATTFTQQAATAGQVDTTGDPFAPPSGQAAAVEAVAGTRRGGVARAAPAPDPLASIPDQLPGALQIDDSVVYPCELPMGIPALRRDRLVTALPPAPLTTWVNEKLSPYDEPVHWLWNWGSGNPTKVPWDRAWLAFFVFDEYFETWWDTPAYFLTKMWHLGVRAFVGFDFSMWSDQPLAVQLFNCYRNFWLTRLAQDLGMAVVPHLTWGHPDTLAWAFVAIPHGAPIVAATLQNMTTPEDFALGERALREAHAAIGFDTLVAYCGKRARPWVEGHAWPFRVVVVDAFQVELTRRKRPDDSEQGAGGSDASLPDVVKKLRHRRPARTKRPDEADEASA